MISESAENTTASNSWPAYFSKPVYNKYTIFKINFKGLIKNIYDSFWEKISLGSFLMKVLELIFDTNLKGEKNKNCKI